VNLPRSCIEAAVLVLALVAAPLSVAVAEDPPKDAVAQTVGHGKVNWTDKTITTTGSGAPDLKAANVAVARLGAERAAKADALRNVIETVKGVRVSGAESAGQAMEQSPEIRTKVEGVVRNFEVVDTKYYSDGGVDVVVKVPLDSVLDALLPAKKDNAPSPADSAAGGPTGVIVNAKGLKVPPALAPRIVDDKGNQIYGADMVNHDALVQRGVVSYAKTVEQAQRDARVSGKPLVVKGVRVTQAGSSDVVIGSDDAAKLAMAKVALGAGKVIIVTD
jgi:hypothetical protein